jgi:hypothetical protein
MGREWSEKVKTFFSWAGSGAKLFPLSLGGDSGVKK